MQRVIIGARSCGQKFARRRVVRLTRYSSTSWFTRLAIADTDDAQARAVVELDPEQLAELGEAALELADESSKAKRRVMQARQGHSKSAL